MGSGGRIAGSTCEWRAEGRVIQENSCTFINGGPGSDLLHCRQCFARSGRLSMQTAQYCLENRCSGSGTGLMLLSTPFCPPTLSYFPRCWGPPGDVFSWKNDDSSASMESSSRPPDFDMDGLSSGDCDTHGHRKASDKTGESTTNNRHINPQMIGEVENLNTLLSTGNWSVSTGSDER